MEFGDVSPSHHWGRIEQKWNLTCCVHTSFRDGSSTANLVAMLLFNELNHLVLIFVCLVFFWGGGGETVLLSRLKQTGTIYFKRRLKGIGLGSSVPLQVCGGCIITVW